MTEREHTAACEAREGLFTCRCPVTEQDEAADPGPIGTESEGDSGGLDRVNRELESLTIGACVVGVTAFVVVLLVNAPLAVLGMLAFLIVSWFVGHLWVSR